MEIAILECLEGAKAARGLAVIIDVFRAFSLQCHLFARGAARVLAVGELDAAYALKEQFPEALLIGERQGFPLPGFDCGNSPALIQGLDIKGKDEKAMAAEIEGLKSTTGRRFFDSATQGSMPEADFRLCTERDVFPFIIRAVPRKEFWEMKAVSGAFHSLNG